MFSNEIELYDAQITAIAHRIKDGAMTSRILVSGTLNQDLAGELDVKSLIFTSNGVAKDGFSKLELSTGCASFRALFEADPALKQSFELTGDSTDNFVVERKDEGLLRLKLRLNYHGDPYAVLAYVMAIGSGESILKISPLQKELEESQDSDVSIVVKRPDGTTHTEHVDKGTVRRALGASRKTRRAYSGGYPD